MPGMAVRRHAGAMDSSVEQFAGRVLGDLAATMSTVFCALGDRLGLFRALAVGPATSTELASATGVNERYVREWASGLYAAEYLDYDPATARFALPAAHAPVLADEGGPAFLGGAHGTVRGMLGVLDRVEAAFRTGGGVPLDAYDERFWLDVERFTGPDYAHRLVQDWIPAVPGLAERLAAGTTVADVGSGSGFAAILLARAFPDATVHGYDVLAANIARAEQLAVAEGVGDRVTFARLDAVQGLPGTYDVITFFGVVHDAYDPLGLLRAAYRALRPGGVCLIQEIASGEQLEDNRGPAGAVLYGFSLLHCTTQSLAAGGPALGTCGLPESRLRKLCGDAGFGSLVRVAEGPLDVLYAAHP
jgi:SAM-dependent methyltransferase